MHNEDIQGAEGLQGSALLGADGVLKQLELILANDLFKKSKRYSDLLRHIVECSVQGRVEELRERAIGHKVFGRSRYYDVSNDPTVRVVATEVRKRLALYYGDHGRHSEVVIEIPAGGYAAEFRLQSPWPETPFGAEPPSGVPVAESTASAVPISSSRWAWFSARRAVVGLLVVLGVGAGCWLLRWSLTPAGVIDRFWAPLTNHSVVISLGSQAAGQGIAAASQGGGGSDSGGLTGFKDCCNNVSMLDVNVGQSFTRFLRQRGADSSIRPANGTRFADFSSGPVIMIGLNNEWLARFGADLPYRFVQESATGKEWIEEAQNPSVRRWGRDPQSAYREVDWDYAIVSRIHEETTGQWLLGVAGFTGAGTARAQEFLTDPEAMETLRRQLPRDWKNRNLQVVLVIKVMKGSPGNAQALAVRSW